MGFVCNALLKFTLFFVNKCFSPSSNSSRNRKKYKELVKLTKKVSKFMIKLDRKWSAIVVSDADFSNPEEFFLNRLDSSFYSSKFEENSSSSPVDNFDLTDADSKHLEQAVDDDLTRIEKEVKEDAFIL